MFYNYFKVALRVITRNKVFSLINIVGLAIGMACTILIFLWVFDELSYDTFHTKHEKIYRLIPHINFGGDTKLAYTPATMGPELKEINPEIQNYVRMLSGASLLFRHGNKIINEKNCVFVDTSFFSTFSFPIYGGNPKKVLKNSYSVVLTQETAQKYFPNEDAIGKNLIINNKFAVKVTGIVGNYPNNSSIQFDAVLPLALYELEFGEDLSNPEIYNYYTYILTKEPASPAFTKKINSFYRNRNPKASEELLLQALDNVRLKSEGIIDVTSSPSLKLVSIFATIALFILLIACINFINLSTAHSGKRSKEIGVRKVVGSKSGQTMTQFIIESVVLSVFACLLSLVLVELFLPEFNALSNKELVIKYSDYNFYLIILLIVGTTGVVSGSYPAMVLSNLEPIKIIYSKIYNLSRQGYLRKVLVVFQFTMSGVIIFSTIVIYRQVGYLENKDLGYNNNNVVYLRLSNHSPTLVSSFTKDITKNNDIENVSATGNFPFWSMNSFTDTLTEKILRINYADVDCNFLETFKINLLKGRNFVKSNKANSLSYIINQTAAKKMQLKIGDNIKLLDQKDTGKVIGIVEDYHFRNFREKIEPMVLRVTTGKDKYLFIRIAEGKTLEATNYLNALFHTYFPDMPFECSYVDSYYNNYYKEERRLAKIFKYFSILAILISCLGLYGLAAFMAEQKTKEIGIRKSMGASAISIILLMSKDFSKLVFIANLLAIPIACIAMQYWLHKFAYKTKIEWWIIILTFSLLLSISLITIIFKAIKSSLANPADSLRYE